MFNETFRNGQPVETPAEERARQQRTTKEIKAAAILFVINLKNPHLEHDFMGSLARFEIATDPSSSAPSLSGPKLGEICPSP
jgi:hypothetical protein